MVWPCVEWQDTSMLAWLCARRSTAWFAVDLVSRSTCGKAKWAGLTYMHWLARDKGAWAGGSHV
jgi:hypothetical protein